ncbi:synaptonemal complex protein zip1, partial [Linnemannia elongata]
KRRRNTAASARFRQKKRLREQILEKTAKEMTAKSEILEARARELEMEIKWLRGLIVEKGSASVGLQGVGPAVLP